MTLWFFVPCIAGSVGVLAGCRATPSAAPPLVAQVSGTIEVAGLSAPVRVVRDRWGVPHIDAQAQDDLFLAQGFVQAQDRLFQMDLWRRSAQGRLAEVLGPNFIDRDAMTRRIQYRGDVDAEWVRYGPDTKAIATAFVRGINAWVAIARDRPPEEFVLAGWKPAFWSPIDLVNRTDAFVASGDVLDEIRRRNLSDVIAEAIRSAGAPPFFAGSSRVPAEQTRVASTGRLGASGSILSIGEAQRSLVHPSVRYLVHLRAPGWNVIGATAPWRPGVALGHNERIAWGMTPIDADTQDIVVEDASTPRTIVKESIVVKRRAAPFVVDLEYTARGVVIAVDRERGQLFTLRWTGFEPGGAAELGALALNRAGTLPEFRAALARWTMPARRVSFIDRDRNIESRNTAPHRGAHATTVTDLGVAPQAIFAHALATNSAAQHRFNIGPFRRPAEDDTPLRARFDISDWDRSVGMNAPGQSESPASDHFADLAKLWSAGELFPLPFSDAAVQQHARSTLVLAPAKQQPETGDQPVSGGRR